MMTQVEYVHQLVEGKKYLFLDKGVFTLAGLFYANEKAEGPDGVFVEERHDPFLWKDVPLIFSIENEEEYDPYFDYEDQVLSAMEM